MEAVGLLEDEGGPLSQEFWTTVFGAWGAFATCDELLFILRWSMRARPSRKDKDTHRLQKRQGDGDGFCGFSLNLLGRVVNEDLPAGEKSASRSTGKCAIWKGKEDEDVL